MPKKEYKVVDLFLWLWRHDARHEKTGKWLAEQLGVSTTTISRWCSNASQPDLHTLNKMAKVLNVNIKDLIIDK